MDLWTSLILIVHFAATWYLVGLCWVVQRIQYPLMAKVGADRFVQFESAHVERIGPIVAPVMVIELGTGAILWLAGGEPFLKAPFVASLVLLGSIWGSTFLLQVPLHERLKRGFEPGTHAALVRTNWIRTLAWSARGLVVCGILVSMLAGSSVG
jgi:hypothetical protein